VLISSVPEMPPGVMVRVVIASAVKEFRSSTACGSTA
jgi:hypothetical protein